MRVTDDETGERFLRYVADDKVRGEIRPEDSGVFWFFDLATSGHWGRADDSESAMGQIDLIREAMGE
jgi:hypothetical protein